MFRWLSRVTDGTGSRVTRILFGNGLGKSYFTFGKQQVVWGKADVLKVLDVVNPPSFRELILEDFFAKIGERKDG